MFAVLDGAGPGGRGLVQLTNDTNSPYFQPSVGEPRPQRFVDEASAPSSRLFGQGASLDIGPYVVASVRRP
jgi:hypothetical protein